MQFQVGDRVSYMGGPDEIVELVEGEFILGRYCNSGILKDWWYPAEYFELIERGAKMSKYEELKSRIEALDNGWTKEADDILDEINRHIDIGGFPYVTIDIPVRKGELRKGELGKKEYCYNSYQVIRIYSGFNKHEMLVEYEYNTQCEKMSAFKQALLWLLDHSDIKKDIVGTEQKVEIEGKVYKARILEKI